MLDTDYREIMITLRRRIIGQPTALSRIERCLKIIQSGLRDSDKPLGILFFAGPTGTGKSELPQALVEAIHNNPQLITRIDCNQLTEPHTVASLTGSPPGYVGSVENHNLIKQEMIAGKPGAPAVIVFEEIEKANLQVYNALLGIFDKGVMALASGKGKLDFTNTIIVMTSNIGARELGAAQRAGLNGFQPVQSETTTLKPAARLNVVMEEMKRKFPPEFIGRIDDIVVFESLTIDDAVMVCRRFLEQLAHKTTSISPHILDVDISAEYFIAHRGYNHATGARSLKSAIRRYMEDPIAEQFADGLPYEFSLIHVMHVGEDDMLTITYHRRSVPGQSLVPIPRAIPDNSVEFVDTAITKAPPEST